MHLGYALDAILQQKDAWASSKEPPHKGTMIHLLWEISSCRFILCIFSEEELKLLSTNFTHAEDNCISPLPQHNCKSETCQEYSTESKEILSTLSVKLNRMDVNTHVMYDGILYHKFAAVSMEDMELTIDSRLPHRKVCEKIAECDTNSFTHGLQYCGINGGYVKMKASEFYVTFNLMTKKYVSITNLGLEGYLYMAR